MMLMPKLFVVLVAWLEPMDTMYPTDRAPLAIKSMITDGDVSLVFSNDPDFVASDTGITSFNLGLSYRYGCEYSTSKKGGRWHIRVKAINVQPIISISHAIRIPIKYRTGDVWNGRLLRHEFDHVAISLDPRPVLLLEYLCQHLPVLEGVLESEERLSAGCRRIINSEIEQRRAAVQSLIQANYELLDRFSRHGTIAVPSRATFFTSLFDMWNLDEQGFPFTDVVLDLLDSAEYQQAELRFLPRDPVRK